MYTFKSESANGLFTQATKVLLEDGERKVPRGLKTLELSPVMLELTDPRNRFLFHPLRNLNPFAIVSELVWICAGAGDIIFPSMFNKQLLNYTDSLDEFIKKGHITINKGMITDFDRQQLKGVEFNAPYGKRIRRAPTEGSTKTIDQLDTIFQELKKDPDSRRGVVCLWDPRRDNLNLKTSDRPCNFALIFKITKGKLNLTVINRSNDILLGLFNVNIPIFTMIQEMMALMLGVELGSYFHFTNSYHMYTDHIVTRNMKLTHEKEEYIYSLAMAERWNTLNIVRHVSGHNNFFNDCKKRNGKYKTKDYSFFTEMENGYNKLMQNNMTSIKVSNVDGIGGSPMRAYIHNYLKAYLDYKRKGIDFLPSSYEFKEGELYNWDWTALAMIFAKSTAKMSLVMSNKEFETYSIYEKIIGLYDEFE